MLMRLQISTLVLIRALNLYFVLQLVLHKKEQRDSANADARSIVDQIKKLRARTSIDDEDRINILTNLERLADQLVDMVSTYYTYKSDNKYLLILISKKTF